MQSVEVPAVLNQLARAGDRGIPADESLTPQIRLAREWRFPVEERNGRLFLQPSDDLLIPALIEAEIPALSWKRCEVEGFLALPSTNDRARVRATEGAAAGLVVYAESQSAGKGRMGRVWFSPPRAGVYVSVLLQPEQPLSRWPLLTFVASTALAHTLSDVGTQTGAATMNVELKWPNDVLIGGKKTAGILLETVRTGPAAHGAIVGCGINVSAEAIPKELAGEATAVSVEAGVTIPRRPLVVAFLKHLQRQFELFESGRYGAILEHWRDLAPMVNGVPVWVIENGEARAAVTCGLSEEGGLRIRTEAGSEQVLLAGDVSVRRER
jgi:BirA family transcriptional regulator, biotin operon repressor / biotin---[acetyl-CoA-carboxylase] ligase